MGANPPYRTGSKWLDHHRTDFKRSPFRLEADEARAEIGAGGLVDFLAVDQNGDGVLVADHGVGIPFTGGLFRIGRGSWDRIAADLVILALERRGVLSGGTGPEVEKSLILMLALALDAFRPDGVRRGHVDDYTSIAGLGETPLNGEPVLFVAFFRPQKSVGGAGASKYAIFHGPSRLGGCAILKVGQPACGVLAIEEHDFGGGDFRSGNGEGTHCEEQGGQGRETQVQSHALMLDAFSWRSRKKGGTAVIRLLPLSIASVYHPQKSRPNNCHCFLLIWQSREAEPFYASIA